MQAKYIGSLLTALALTTLGAAAQAAPQAKSPAVIIKTAAPQAAVVVKLGSAMLEEYHGGDPASRTTIYRDGAATQKPSANKIVPKSQG